MSLIVFYTSKIIFLLKRYFFNFSRKILITNKSHWKCITQAIIGICITLMVSFLTTTPKNSDYENRNNYSFHFTKLH